MKNNLVFYHRVDLDGVASAAIVADYAKINDEGCICTGWTYGDKVPKDMDVSDFDKIWIVDISFGPKHVELVEKWEKEGKEVIWIDHHKSAITPDTEHIGGLRAIGKGACELTWEYIYHYEAPLIIQYLSIYDVWDKDRFNWRNLMAVQYAMRAEVGLNYRNMIPYLNRDIEDHLMEDLILQGRAILNFLAQKNEEECNNFSFEATVGKYRAICMNTLEFNSTTFDSVWDEEKYDIMMPFAVQNNGLVRFSLYTTKEDVDCSEIAKTFGGGGHKKAAGFMVADDSSLFKDFISEREIKI